MTMTLVEFLKARLDEDERIARGAAQRGAEWRLLTGVNDEELGDAELLHGGNSPDELAHMQRHDPARVLVEVRAKRRIVDELAEAKARCIERPESYMRAEVGNALLLVARHLALPYADHPDYNPEWRPG